MNMHDKKKSHSTSRQKSKETDPCEAKKKGNTADTAGEEQEETPVSLVQSEYDALVQGKKDFEDKFLRTAAEYDNYKKRVQKEKTLWERGVYKEMLRDILSIYNSVNRGLEAGDDTLSGLKALKEQIVSILERHRVSPIEARGKKFDPDFHEALFTENTDEVPDKTVLEEIEPGYMFDGIVLIPSKVKVSQFPDTDGSGAEEADKDEKNDNDESPEQDTQRAESEMHSPDS